jgi:hypothetical protein
MMSSNIRHQMVGRLSTSQNVAYAGTAGVITNAVGNRDLYRAGGLHH